MRQVVLLAVFASLATSPAAAITCNGNFQVVNGQEISTPFCRDNALAAVARQYGYKISDKEMRNNPSRKEEIAAHFAMTTKFIQRAPRSYPMVAAGINCSVLKYLACAQQIHRPID